MTPFKPQLMAILLLLLPLSGFGAEEKDPKKYNFVDDSRVYCKKNPKTKYCIEVHPEMAILHITEKVLCRPKNRMSCDGKKCKNVRGDISIRLEENSMTVCLGKGDCMDSEIGFSALSGKRWALQPKNSPQSLMVVDQLTPPRTFSFADLSESSGKILVGRCTVEKP